MVDVYGHFSRPSYGKSDGCSVCNHFFAPFEDEARIFRWLSSNDRKLSRLQALSAFTNQKPFMLSVPKIDSIKIILYTSSLSPCCAACPNLQAPPSPAPPASCPHALRAGSSASAPGLGSSLTSASAPWVLFAVLSWIAESVPGGAACLRKLGKHRMNSGKTSPLPTPAWALPEHLN